MGFQIDKEATIGSILEALRTEGVKTGDVAKAIEGISEKPLRKALKEAGYVFSNKTPKGWRYVAEGVEPLDTSIFDYVNRSNPKVNSSNTLVTRSNTDITEISPIVHPQFTRDEVVDLMEMLQDWRMKNVMAQVEKSEEPTQVHERIKALPQGDKTRKTIVIDKGIGERLDAYCKAERVNKSDILHLAIEDFLNKI